MLGLRFVSGFALLAALCWALAARGQAPVTITVQGEARPEGEMASEPFVASSKITGERLAAPAVRAADVLRGEHHAFAEFLHRLRNFIQGVGQVLDILSF